MSIKESEEERNRMMQYEQKFGSEAAPVQGAVDAKEEG